jgi:hypothetical protein
MDMETDPEKEECEINMIHNNVTFSPGIVGSSLFNLIKEQPGNYTVTDFSKAGEDTQN